MSQPSGFHMSPEQFREHGHAVVDWVADYLAGVERFPVQSPAAPGATRALLPPAAPESPEPFADVLADLDRVVLPGVTHWQSPNFFGYFPANSSGPAVLGELVSAGLGVQGMLWATSPAATELETHVMDWLVDLCGLPAAFRSDGPGGGVIQDSASSSSLVALLAARERATGGRTNTGGAGAAGRLTAYTSTQAHSSIEKAVRIAGIGSDNLRLVDVDDDLAMQPDELDRLMRADAEAGAVPFFVVATVGTTSTTAIDPLREIGEVCRRYGAWLHVDAAHAGTAALCPELRWVNAGVDAADSYVFDAHKWMFTNFDCSAFFVADRRALVTALSILPEYLRNAATESGAVIDYRDWMIPLGRRFRALKLWFVLRWYGAEGLRHHVREHVRLARDFTDWVDADPAFERLTATTVNLVCFRHLGGDELNERLLAELNASGRVLLTHTRVHGHYALRMSIGGTYTERRHVERAWELITETASRLSREPSGAARPRR